MKIFKVYKITNRINKKSYIGQTSYDIEHRWKRHISAAKNGSKFRFHSAIRKYGVSQWDMEELYSTTDYNDVLIKETHFITMYKTNTKFGYNATSGGTGGWVVNDIDSWRKKIVISTTGKNNPNWCGITDEELIDIMVNFSKKLGRIPSLNEARKSVNKKIPKSFSKNRFGGSVHNLYKIVEDLTGLKYNSYYKSEEHRKKLSQECSKWIWINNGIENKRILKEELLMYKDFKRGKISVNKN